MQATTTANSTPALQARYAKAIEAYKRGRPRIELDSIRSRRFDYTTIALSLLATAASLLLALAPAAASADEGFEAARGRYDLCDGRVASLGGTRRRPVLTIDDTTSIALAPLHEGATTSVDGRVMLRFVAQPNGVVTGVRLTQRR